MILIACSTCKHRNCEEVCRGCDAITQKSFFFTQGWSYGSINFGYQHWESLYPIEEVQNFPENLFEI